MVNETAIIDERVSFSWKVTITFIGAALMLGGIYARSEYNDSRLNEKLFDLKAAQISNQILNIKSQTANTEVLRGLLEQSKIQTALTKARLMDRWTAGMEDEDNREWVQFLMSAFPELNWTDAPDTRKTQAKHLQYLFNTLGLEE